MASHESLARGADRSRRPSTLAYWRRYLGGQTVEQLNPRLARKLLRVAFNGQRPADEVSR